MPKSKDSLSAVRTRPVIAKAVFLRLKPRSVHHSVEWQTVLGIAHLHCTKRSEVQVSPARI